MSLVALAGLACGNTVRFESGSSTTSAGGASSTGAGGSGGQVEHLQHAWSKRFGGAGFERVFGVAAGSSSDIVLCGDFNGDVDFGGGALSSGPKSDLFLARLDAAGDHVWSAAFGDVMGGSLCDVATDASGDVVVGGEFDKELSLGGPLLVSAGSSDIFVAKLGPTGEHLWSQRFGDEYPQSHPAVAVDSKGAVILAGGFMGSVSFGGATLVAQGADVYVAKLDAAGSHVWSVRVGDEWEQRALDVAVDAQDNIYLVGRFQGTLDFGAPLVESAGTGDAFLVKLDAQGNYLWGKQFGDPETEGATVVRVAPSGDVAVAGYFNGDIDLGGGVVQNPGYHSFFVAEYAPDGHPLWSATHGEAGGPDVWSIAPTAAGGVVAAGAFSGALDFGGAGIASQGPETDVFLASLDAQGAPLSVRSCGSADIDSPAGVIVAEDGSIVLVANVEGPSDFGGEPLSFAGSSDVVVAKYSP